MWPLAVKKVYSPCICNSKCGLDKHWLEGPTLGIFASPGAVFRAVFSLIQLTSVGLGWCVWPDFLQFTIGRGNMSPRSAYSAGMKVMISCWLLQETYKLAWTIGCKTVSCLIWHWSVNQSSKYSVEGTYKLIVDAWKVCGCWLGQGHMTLLVNVSFDYKIQVGSSAVARLAWTSLCVRSPSAPPKPKYKMPQVVKLKLFFKNKSYKRLKS